MIRRICKKSHKGNKLHLTCASPRPAISSHQTVLEYNTRSMYEVWIGITVIQKRLQLPEMSINGSPRGRDLASRGRAFRSMPPAAPAPAPISPASDSCLCVCARRPALIEYMCSFQTLGVISDHIGVYKRLTRYTLHIRRTTTWPVVAKYMTFFPNKYFIQDFKKLSTNLLKVCQIYYLLVVNNSR